MGLMMLSKEDISLISDTLPDDLLDVQFLAEPNGKGLQPRPQPFGSDRQISQEQALKSQEWFVVKNDIGQILCHDVRLFQAIPDSVFRKSGIVFLPCEALFLSGGNNFTITDQAGGTIMVKAGNAEYVQSVTFSGRP
jgi:hypothetical protein